MPSPAHTRGPTRGRSYTRDADVGRVNYANLQGKYWWLSTLSTYCGNLSAYFVLHYASGSNTDRFGSMICPVFGPSAEHNLCRNSGAGPVTERIGSVL